MPRTIKEIAFWGCGTERGEAQVQHLQLLLEDCISLSSGLQQPAHSESEADAKADRKERAKLEKVLKDKVADIAAAFGYELYLEENMPFGGSGSCPECGG